MNVRDEVGGTVLNSSSFGGNTIDFVAQDNNSGRRPVGDTTYPEVFQFDGTGVYQIEYANDVRTLGDGATTITMGASEVIDIRDSYQETGEPTYYRVVPTGGAQDPELALMESVEGDPSTYVPRRSQAVALSDSGGPGEAESLNHTSPADQYEGFILLNKAAASGDYTVYRDTTAPSGSVSINDGAETTSSREVTLSLSATDSETGLLDMRVSTDGTIDDEAWEPYATSKSVTLPEGIGEKTVLVQFRNNAGMASDTVSDTIVYNTAPPGPTVTNSVPSAGAVTVSFTDNGDGGSAITSYGVNCVSTNGGTSRIATGTSSPIKVIDLTGGKDYRCRVRATNAVGTGAYGAYGATVTLPPPTAPPAPTVTSTTPSAGAVTVAFESTGNGGSLITSYGVSCVSTNGGTARTATGTTSPIKVINLTGGKDYRCRVRATNAVGTGTYGSYGATVTLPPPTAPPAPTVTSTTPSTGAVTVAFTSNGDGGSPNTGYGVACVSTNGGTARNATGTTSPIKVLNLTSGRSYRCRVRATNAVGTSAYSPYGTTVAVP